MATPVASLNAPSQPTADAFAINTARGAQATGAPGEFQAALVAAGSEVTRAAEVEAVADTPEIVAAVEEVEEDVVTGLVGLVNQFQFLNPPTNAAVAQANGTAIAVEATITTDAAELATRTRADELLLNQPAARQATQPNAQPPLTQDNQLPIPTPATQPTTPAIPTQPAISDTPNEVASRAANTVRGGLPNIPAQAPIVTNLIPIPPAPNDLSTLEPVVSATIAAVPASGLPGASLGERPGNAGEQFAAIASAGAQLALTAPVPQSRVFENELAEATATNLPPAADRLEDRLATLGNAVTAPPANFLAELRSSGVITSNAVTATPATQIADEVVSQARVLERPGAVEFQMRLDPPELGRVQIRLIANGDEINGQVLVADDAVRRMIESQLPELRQRLEAAGVNIQRFDIATDADTRGNGNNYRDAEAEFAPRIATPESPLAPRARIGRTEPGSVDVMV